MDFNSAVKLTIGYDYLWWLVPTRPELWTNFYERVWEKRKVKQMYKAGKFDMEEEHSDPDKKLFAEEQRKARFEKKLFLLVVVVLLLAWFFVLSEILYDKGMNEWKWETKPVPK